MTRLVDLATTIRSKNAGVDHITFDVIFSHAEAFHRAVQSGVLRHEAIARLFNVPLEAITYVAAVDAAHAIKFTVRRPRPSGAPGERDVFGSQQYGPLLDLEVE